MDELQEKEVPEQGIEERQKAGPRRERGRFEFAMYVNDTLICRRSFHSSGYIEKSMVSTQFLDEFNSIVDLIQDDLNSKSRVYTWYHTNTEHPDWEPEIMTDPLIPEGQCVIKFAMFDYDREVISRVWDARYYPAYIRKNIDLTNKQVRVIRDDKVVTYDKDVFFAENPQISGEMYILREMLAGKEDLTQAIQNIIYSTCFEGDEFEKISDYELAESYYTCDYKRDAEGNAICEQQVIDGVPQVDALGRPWMEYKYEKRQTGNSKKYNLNIQHYNRKLEEEWDKATKKKSEKYFKSLYVLPQPPVRNGKKKK